MTTPPIAIHRFRKAPAVAIMAFISDYRVGEREVEVAVQNNNNSAQRERTRINVNEADQLFDWADKFGVSTGLLRRAVQAVGRDPAAVRQHLASAR